MDVSNIQRNKLKKEALKPNKLILSIILLAIIAMAFGFLQVDHMTVVNHAEATQSLAEVGTGSILDSLKYEKSIHILAMLLVGFGFLMVFVRKHGFSSITATFLMVSISIPLYMLIRNFGGEEFKMSLVSIDTFILAEFAAASLLIAIGAPLGRLKMDQYILMAFLFIPAYVLNEWLLLESGIFTGFLDTGGSVVIHAFGAYFGLGVVAKSFGKFEKGPSCENDKSSNQFCLIGSMILWVFWPSFTSALVAPSEVVLTAINTVFALSGSTLATYVFSKWIRGKIEIEDIANAALAGGVAIGSACNTASPGLAMLIGITAGAVSTIGYTKIAPKVEKFISGTDTCGVHNLHGMPGIIGGLAGIIITGNFGIQLGGIVTTLVIAFVTGRIAGSVLDILGKKSVPYSDEDEFALDH